MMPLTTVERVREYLRLPDGDATVALTELVDAVTALVASYHAAPAADDEWPPNLQLGATMLAARLYRRRNSPAGVEALGELGPVYVSRNDPDLAQLLKIGRYAPPRVG